MTRLVPGINTSSISGKLLATAAILSVFLLVAALRTVLIQFVYLWAVPDVFETAVRIGLIPQSLTFWQAFKLSVLAAVLTHQYQTDGKKE